MRNYFKDEIKSISTASPNTPLLPVEDYAGIPKSIRDEFLKKEANKLLAMMRSPTGAIPTNLTLDNPTVVRQYFEALYADPRPGFFERREQVNNTAQYLILKALQEQQPVLINEDDSPEQIAAKLKKEHDNAMKRVNTLIKPIAQYFSSDPACAPAAQGQNPFKVRDEVLNTFKNFNDAAATYTNDWFKAKKELLEEIDGHLEYYGRAQKLQNEIKDTKPTDNNIENIYKKELKEIKDELDKTEKSATKDPTLLANYKWFIEEERFRAKERALKAEFMAIDRPGVLGTDQEKQARRNQIQLALNVNQQLLNAHLNNNANKPDENARDALKEPLKKAKLLMQKEERLLLQKERIKADKALGKEQKMDYQTAIKGLPPQSNGQPPLRIGLDHLKNAIADTNNPFDRDTATVEQKISDYQNDIEDEVNAARPIQLGPVSQALQEKLTVVKLPDMQGSDGLLQQHIQKVNSVLEVLAEMKAVLEQFPEQDPSHEESYRRQRNLLRARLAQLAAYLHKTEHTISYHPELQQLKKQVVELQNNFNRTKESFHCIGKDKDGDKLYTVSTHRYIDGRWTLDKQIKDFEHNTIKLKKSDVQMICKWGNNFNSFIADREALKDRKKNAGADPDVMPLKPSEERLLNWMETARFKTEHGEKTVENIIFELSEKAKIAFSKQPSINMMFDRVALGTRKLFTADRVFSDGFDVECVDKSTRDAFIDAERALSVFTNNELSDNPKNSFSTTANTPSSSFSTTATTPVI